MDCNYLFSFHILDLNMNELVLVKGCIEVVSNNSVSMVVGTDLVPRLRCKTT